MEEWIDIQGYEGYYQVSNFGRVKSLKRNIIMKSQQRKGYQSVLLTKNKNTKRFDIHRLVAKAFLPNENEKKNQVNHLNEIKSDNRACNLCWCTPLENTRWGTGIKRATKTRERPVISTNKKTGEIKRYKSTREASRQTNIWQSQIARCCIGIGYSAGGMVWKYEI